MMNHLNKSGVTSGFTRRSSPAGEPHRYVVREIALNSRACNLLSLVAVLILACLGGCTDDGGSCPEDLPPTACVRMSVVEYSGPCPLTVEFRINPSCSHDDRTPYEDLQIRWDFGADGTWDTDFGPLKARWDGGPSSVSAAIWRVRCELRDLAGQTSEAVDSLDLRPLLPRPPDIMAGRLVVELEGSWREVDTVSVGERFVVFTYQRCWMDPTEDLYLIEYRLDGEILDQAWAHVTPAVGGCHSYGKGGLTIDQAGTYQIQTTLDAANTIPESNEMNNVASKSLVVVSVPPD
jgi:hypothetical protein